ncbi:hypothetical protein [Candidatus Fukatsuia endosymbiont of Tuberolachnus salignus]|uniref:hypothetical protein n=1 Tax=Candidatus Fukatsuia endosymbiont of Tuberolachnus salignus TaxID=3077957 RepID=UPI00313BE0EB
MSFSEDDRTISLIKLNLLCIERKILVQWLKAGFIEKWRLFFTSAGTPQGGIITPQTIVQTFA